MNDCCGGDHLKKGSLAGEQKQKTLDRLARIEGQVRGIRRMIEEDRYCVDVLTQVAAVRAALGRVGLLLLENHTEHCVANALQHGEGEAAVKELLDVMSKFVR